MSMKRIVMHWTAGGHKANSTDRMHYHFMVEGDGNIVTGDHPVSDNESTADGNYAAHTGRLNTGSIGVSFCAMAGAQESPFNPGAYPITEAQVEAMCDLVADLAGEYDIPITRETVLTHAEVQPTLGVAQSGKWDVTVLPGMTAPGNPVEVGDRLRDLIREDGPAEPAPSSDLVARVKDLEKRLASIENWIASF